MSLSSLRARFRDQDRGATIVLVALMITALFTIVAIVIDLGSLRSQRRESQSAVDASASAGGIALGAGDGQAACIDALGYLVVNLEVPAFTGTTCATFAGTCDAATPERTTVGTSAQYTVTLVYPVTAGSPTGVMNGSAIGNPSVAASPDDATPCDRFGVKVDIHGTSYFGGVANLGGGNDTSVHAVARLRRGQTDSRPLNLLLLDRTSCQTIRATGQATLIVEAPFDPTRGAAGEFVPGIAAADSNGTTGCGGNKAIIEASGSNTFIRSDGPCPDPTMTIGCGDGQGLIEVFGSQGLIDGRCAGSSESPSCNGFDDASIVPNVRASLGRFTRAPIDYRYNCKPSYTGEPWYSSQDIPGCSDPLSGRYIDTLKAYAAGINASSPGWTRISGTNTGCRVDTPRVYPPGNYFVDCSNFRVQDVADFQGGNVVFNGDISLTSSGDLRTNSCVSPVVCGSMTWTPGNPYTAVNAAQSSADAAWAYVKGSIDKSASGAIDFDHTLIVLAPSSGGTSLTGNASGKLVWVAPTDGPFDDLALWSESSSDVSFSGQSVLTLEGVFFTPVAEVIYTGQGGQSQADAQFIALRLRVAGQGSFGILPQPGRAVEFPVDPTSGLIR